MSDAPNTALFENAARIGKLEAILGELTRYRDFVPEHPTSTKRGVGHILPFVKGLYFSAKIIYFIREVLSGKPLEVHWGHIIHGSKVYLSPECDIIIHTPGSKTVWNGDVLDFHFVELTKVVAVISCKSIVTSVDDDYCKNLREFGVGSVGLMGEVCKSSAFDRLKNKATEAGYRDFWCLALENDGVRTCDERISLGFVNYLESL